MQQSVDELNARAGLDDWVGWLEAVNFRSSRVGKSKDIYSIAKSQLKLAVEQLFASPPKDSFYGWRTSRLRVCVEQE